MCLIMAHAEAKFVGVSNQYSFCVNLKYPDMSFWNLLCEAILLDKICRWIFPKKKVSSQSYQPHYDHATQCGYAARIEELEQEIKESQKRLAEYQKLTGNRSIGNYENIDQIQERIDELENQMDEYDDTSDRYDLIQEEIVLLQDSLDDIEEAEWMEDDINSFNNDIYDTDLYREDW